MNRALHLVAVTAAGVLAGIVVGVWLIELSIGETAELWIGFHQAIRGLFTLVVPPLGALSLVATAAALLTHRHPPVPRRLLVAAVILLVVGMIVTLGVHFPLNAEIDSWEPTLPPAEWELVRDRWLLAHAVRSVLALVVFVLLVAAATGAGSAGDSSPSGSTQVPQTLG